MASRGRGDGMSEITLEDIPADFINAHLKALTGRDVDLSFQPPPFEYARATVFRDKNDLDITRLASILAIAWRTRLPGWPECRCCASAMIFRRRTLRWLDAGTPGSSSSRHPHMPAPRWDRQHPCWHTNLHPPGRCTARSSCRTYGQLTAIGGGVTLGLMDGMHTGLR